MIKKEKKLIKPIKEILKELKGYKPCGEFESDCANCKIIILIGYLYWLLDLEEIKEVF